MLKKIALKKNYVLASAAPILMRKYYLLPLMSDNFMHTYSQLFCNFFATFLQQKQLMKTLSLQFKPLFLLIFTLI